MLEEIIADLAGNYKSTDLAVLTTLLDEIKVNALKISNREETADNLNLLKSEIKKAVKTIYLQRGTEDTKSLSESGRSSTFDDAVDRLRKDIVKNGKRVVF